MKKLIFVLLFPLCTYATHFDFGTGSGSLTLSSMAGHASGDTALCVAGVYTGGFNITNINGIIFLAKNGPGTVTVTGGGNITTSKYCEIANLDFATNGATVFTWTGACSHMNIHNLTLSRCGDLINSQGGTFQYTPYDTATLNGYMNVIHDITMFNSGFIIFGSFGEYQNFAHFWDSTIVYNVHCDSTRTNGTYIRGVFLRCDFHDNSFTYKGTNTILGDCGIFYIYGNGKFYKTYQDGGRAYIIRLWNVTNATSNPVTSKIYDNIGMNTNMYGLVDAREEQAQIVAGVSIGGHTDIWNNTMGNKTGTNGETCPVLILGALTVNISGIPTKYHITLRNNVGFNSFLQPSDHNQDMKNNSGESYPIGDSSNNQQWASATQTKLDSTTAYITNSSGSFATWKPITGSPLIGAGVNVGLSTDIYGIAWSNPPAIGAAMSGGSPPPPPCTNCGLHRKLPTFMKNIP